MSFSARAAIAQAAQDALVYGTGILDVRQSGRYVFMRSIPVQDFRHLWGFAAKPTQLGDNVKLMQFPKSKKAKPEKFNTIGVRFPENPGKEYTYKVRIGAKPYLGQELVADTPRGQAVVFVTRIDKTPKPTYDIELKYIERKAVAL